MSDKLLPDTKTQEQLAAELEGRIKSFNAELMPLLKKYGLGLSAELYIINAGGSIRIRPILVDATKTVEETTEPASDIAVDE